jgi:translation initiation factor 1
MKLTSLSDLERLLTKEERSDSQVRKESGERRHDGKGRRVRISLDTKGRKGKTVTIVTGLHHNPATMEDIARVLKQYCGAGGSVKEGEIEIQGDQRTRVTGKMRKMGYVVEE